MPTNILRGRRNTGAQPMRPASGVSSRRDVVLKAGGTTLRVELADTPTAARIAAALPLHSAAETWGSCVHFEVPVESGRDRTARALATAGELYFWSEEDRVVVPFGPTPISRAGEIRLMRPCNVIGRLVDDPVVLATLTPGQKISLELA